MALGSRMVNLLSRSVTLSYQPYHWYGCTVQWIQIDNNTDGRWWIYEIYHPYRIVVLDHVPHSGNDMLINLHQRPQLHARYQIHITARRATSTKMLLGLLQRFIIIQLLTNSVILS